MPRRQKPDDFAAKVGRRIRELRIEAGLTIEKLAYESDLGSKGHLSSLERGLARPNIETLRVLAERLGCLPLDLLTFPDDDQRQAFIDRSRLLSKSALRTLAAEARMVPREVKERPHREPSSPRTAKGRVSAPSTRRAPR